MGKKTGYHHGNLRAALVEAALAILEAEGLPGLTLRKVAARAGVSHAAPAHHFPSLQALLTALATIAFDRFTHSMARARARARQDPSAQVRAAGRGYLAFARGHPALFRLMFSAGDLDWQDQALQAAGAAAFGQLQEISAPFADQLGLTGEADRRELERLIWASAHGYAHLAIDGKMPATGHPPDVARFLSRR
jgi:AcrR family transcriptional regulator